MDVRNWRVVTKLPGIPDGCSDVGRWVRDSVAASIKRLKVPQLHGVLLHKPRELLGSQGHSLYAALVALRQTGETAAIGVSIYGPEELDLYWQQFTFDIVQAPFNVIDRRLSSSGWLARLTKAGVKVHTRSAFLQGLLLMTPATRPKAFETWQPLWDQWDAWLRSEHVTALQACINFAQATPGIDRIIVGVDSRSQLREILSAAAKTAPTVPASLASNDQHLINPGNWNAS
jgi:aryl-alcohol dehydrogenase-like predicted oxidoreductase